MEGEGLGGGQGPSEWLKGLKRGSHLLLLKRAEPPSPRHNYPRVPDKPFLLYYIFSLQDRFALIQLGFTCTKREGHTL